MPRFFEGISLYRAERSPGLELSEITFCSHPWWSFCTGIELIVPETFFARVWYRKRLYQLAPGQIFCVAPEEVVKVVHVQQPGALKILRLDRVLLSGPGASHEARGNGPTSLPTIAHAVPLRATVLDGVFQALRQRQPIDPPVVVAALVVAIQAAPCACKLAAIEAGGNGSAACSCRSRESTLRCSGSAPGWSRAELSRFQAHRRFKYRYGLPPHAYELCVRIARSKDLLRSGCSPSNVAAAQGFVDQSHFARHFKRLVGLTPSEFAGSGNVPSSRRSRRSGG